jgi:hypothetical protein
MMTIIFGARGARHEEFVVLLSNRLVAFGAVLLAPVVVNIFAAHALVMHEGVGLPIALVAALAFTALAAARGVSPALRREARCGPGSRAHLLS